MYERPQDTAHCFQLTQANPVDHLEMIKNCRLCFCCLAKGHMLKDCTKHVKCGVDACGHFHHVLLDNVCGHVVNA